MSKSGWEEWHRSALGISPATEINRRLLDFFALYNQFTELVSLDRAMCLEDAAAGIIPHHLQQMQQHLVDSRFLQETQRKEQQ